MKGSQPGTNSISLTVAFVTEESNMKGLRAHSYVWK